MKTIAVRWLALVALMFPVVSFAASTPEQVAAWQADFPAAVSTDSVKLRQFIALYQQAVNRVKPEAVKTISLLRDKFGRDQDMLNKTLHPPKPNPKITPAIQAEAAAASKWLNGKFAPYLAKAPL